MEVNRNLYFKEIKRNRKSLIIWSIIIFWFTILVLSLFPYMKDLNKEMSVMMDKMPEALSKTLGLNSQTFNSILGMYNTYYGIYIIVLLSIYASSTGATIFSKEERNKGIMVGLVFGSYFINTIAKVAETVNWLGYISPFHYLDFEVTSPTYSLNVLQLGVMLFICALLLIASCRIFNKKDIYT